MVTSVSTAHLLSIVVASSLLFFYQTKNISVSLLYHRNLTSLTYSLPTPSTLAVHRTIYIGHNAVEWEDLRLQSSYVLRFYVDFSSNSKIGDGKCPLISLHELTSAWSRSLSNLLGGGSSRERGRR